MPPVVLHSFTPELLVLAATASTTHSPFLVEAFSPLVTLSFGSLTLSYGEDSAKKCCFLPGRGNFLPLLGAAPSPWRGRIPSSVIWKESPLNHRKPY